jgi:hypothetical protein
MFGSRPQIKKPSFRISFIGREKGVNIVKNYDKQSLYPMLLKCYHYLSYDSEVGCVDETTNANSNLDIFE